MVQAVRYISLQRVQLFRKQIIYTNHGSFVILPFVQLLRYRQVSLRYDVVLVLNNASSMWYFFTRPKNSFTHVIRSCCSLVYCRVCYLIFLRKFWYMKGKHGFMENDPLPAMSAPKIYYLSESRPKYATPR